LKTKFQGILSLVGGGVKNKSIRVIIYVFADSLKKAYPIDPQRLYSVNIGIIHYSYVDGVLGGCPRIESLLRKSGFWSIFPMKIVKYNQYSPLLIEKLVSKPLPLATTSILGQPPSKSIAHNTDCSRGFAFYLLGTFVSTESHCDAIGADTYYFGCHLMQLNDRTVMFFDGEK